MGMMPGGRQRRWESLFRRYGISASPDTGQEPRETEQWKSEELEPQQEAQRRLLPEGQPPRHRPKNRNGRAQ